MLPQRVKVIEDMFASIRRVYNPYPYADADPNEYILTPSHLSKTKVFPLDHIQPKLLSLTMSPPTNNEVSPDIHSDVVDRIKRSPSANSLSRKFKRLRTLTIVLGTLLGICALAGLAIGLYFVISDNLKTTSTTTTTTPACPTGLCWNTSGVTVFGTGSTSTNSDNLYNPYYLVIDSSGSFYVADRYNNRIQKFTASSVVGTTVAGQGNGNWAAGSYYLNQPLCVLVDSAGNLYVSDSQNHRIQYFANGSLSGITVAGITGSPGSALNQLNTPQGLALDSSKGILYICDTGNHRIMAYPSGATSGYVAAGGNGGGYYNYQLNAPAGLYLNVSSNSLYIANCNAHNIVRWVVNASTWTLVAGDINGQSGSTSITLNSPTDVTFDYMGNLYVADSGNDRIQLFLSGQFNGTTIAGITSVYASAANTLDGPQSVKLDSDLNLYVADTLNNRIQKFQWY